MAKSGKDLTGNVTPIETPSLLRPEKEVIKQKLEEIIEKDKRLVKGTFVYEEFPGSAFTFKNTKYKGVSCNITMADGQVYEIPKWLADFINGKDASKDVFNENADRTTNTCAVPINYYKTGANDPLKPMIDGHNIPVIEQKYKKKMRFIPLTFGEE